MVTLDFAATVLPMADRLSGQRCIYSFSAPPPCRICRFSPLPVQSPRRADPWVPAFEPQWRRP
jgi:hypothetical protein